MNTISLDEKYSTTRLLCKIVNDECLMLDADGRIKEEYKWNINSPELGIKNSKLIGNPEDKFETTLFLPVGEGRKGEGGLRTKGYFKRSYVWCESESEGGGKIGAWFITDSDNKPIKPAPSKIQKKLNEYFSSNYPHSHSHTHLLPLITVITVVYNGEKYLEETILSVLNQTYDNVEYIIIDGGSTDGTLDIIRKYEHAIDYWVSEKDRGIYDAMNKGILLSTGDVIGLLNASDCYEKNAFELLVSKFEPDKKFCVYFGDVYYHYTDLDIKIRVKAKLSKIIHSMTISHQATFITKPVYNKYGLYDLKYSYAADYAYILGLFLSKYQFVDLEDIVACFATGGTSDQKIFQSRLESIKAQFQLNSPQKYYAAALYLKEICYQYTYNLLIFFLGKSRAAQFRKRRLLARYPDHLILEKI